MKHTILILLSVLSLLVSCGKKEPSIPKEEEPNNQLEATLQMDFHKSNLPGRGLRHIVFTPDGRAAALETKGDVYFSADDGVSWSNIHTFGADSSIQSIALHPEKDIIFLGARFAHNHNVYPRYLILRRGTGEKWPDMTIMTPQYKDQQSNAQYLPLSFQYNHSYWFDNYVVNSLADAEGNNGFIVAFFDPENTGKQPDSRVLWPESKRPMVSRCFIPIHDGRPDKLFLCSAKEIIQAPHYFNANIYPLTNLSYSKTNSTDNYGKPECCIPDYLCASPDLKAKNFNQLMLYTGIRRLYHTVIRIGALHQQQLLISNDQVGHSDWLCTGIDGKGHVWLGTKENGVFKSAKPLPTKS